MNVLSEQSREHLMMRTTECWNDGRSSIQKKIEQARELHSVWGGKLRRDPSIQDLLVRLEKSLETSREAMLSHGIVDACKQCDEDEGGSCCGAGLENKLDEILLLINLLLGVSLPECHCRPDSCYLLSARGCILKVRLVLCVDFLCTKILSSLTHQELIRLQNIAGEELVIGFMLYDTIKKNLRSMARE
jgi:hypothetical protein